MATLPSAVERARAKFMGKLQKMSLFLLRVSLGGLYFYAGITKVMTPNWSAARYLQGAKTFTWFYQALLGSSLMPLVNFLNEWGLTLLGVSLILGIFVRLSSWLGIILMFLYYFVVLQFPYVAPHSFIVDDHIIYSAGLLVLIAFSAGRIWGLDSWCAKLPICAKYPKLRKIIG